MKQRQNSLDVMLREHYGIGTDPGTVILKADLIRKGLFKEVERVYRKLGGIMDEVPLRFGGWDIILKDFIVELDEEQHFNRYRAETLNSFVYSVVKGFHSADYIIYCTDYERECIRKACWGKYWANDSTAKQFGPSGDAGDLSENGSSRWKQRAFYDYLKDVFSVIYGLRLIRISVYDPIVSIGRIKTAGEILSGENTTGLNEIVKFIDRKVNRLL